MATNLTKERAITKLQKLIDRLESFKNRDRETPEFQVWKRNASHTLASIFGQDSSHAEGFSQISYTSTSFFTTPKQDFQNGLKGAKALLQSAIDEITDEWDGEDKLIETKQETSVNASPASDSPGTAKDARNIFVVHGRNLAARDALFRFLRSIGLRPLEWSQAIEATGKASPFIGEVLDAAFSKAQAVVVLMTPDDKARVRKRFILDDDPPSEIELTNQARPNVLFEAGMAMGRSPERTILVQLGKLRPFSDIGGRHVIKLDDSTKRRQDLARRLMSVGCPVDLSGTDWHTEGDFSI